MTADEHTSRDGCRITIVVDDSATAPLAAEHGFSAWIEAGDQRLLFDTGQGAALAPNADRLGVPLHAAEALVLSHGHYDHTGGLPLVIERAPAVDIYCHPDTTSRRYAVRAQPKLIDMPASSRVAMEGHPPGRLNWVTEPRQLAANVGLSGPIPRRASSARRGPFFLDLAGERPDPLDDDLALWIRTGSGLVVVVGCCHAGVLDTLSHVEALTGGARLRALIGGLHLADASDEEIERAAAALQERDPELVVPCHCTGQRAVDALRRVLGDRVAAGAAGTTFAFGEDTPATTSERA